MILKTIYNYHRYSHGAEKILLSKKQKILVLYCFFITIFILVFIFNKFKDIGICYYNYLSEFKSDDLEEGIWRSMLDFRYLCLYQFHTV